MRSAIEAFKLANGLFVIPLMMAYAPLLLTGDNGWPQVLFAGVVTLGMVITIAMLNERFLFAPLNKVGFVVGIAAIILLLIPFDLSRAIGLVVVIALVFWNARLSRNNA